MNVLEIGNLTVTPPGLSDDELIARYRAAGLLATAHEITRESILRDWAPSHLAYVSGLAEMSTSNKNNNQTDSVIVECIRDYVAETSATDLAAAIDAWVASTDLTMFESAEDALCSFIDHVEAVIP